MPRRPDLIGVRFSRLLVISASTLPNGGFGWRCRCDCGAEVIRAVGPLRSGNTKSCGCLHRQTVIARNIARGRVDRPYRRWPTEHVIWRTMIARCHNPHAKDWRNYGGRGIAVCPRWREDFSAFLADMGARPSVAHSIDRTDNGGNYEPANCRWATLRQQARNRRSSRFLTFNGETRTIIEWAEVLSIGPKALLYRLKHWTIEAAMTLPLGQWRHATRTSRKGEVNGITRS